MNNSTAPLAKFSHVQGSKSPDIISTGHVVLETRDYALFKTLNGNRAINTMHIRRLKESFRATPLFTVIFVNELYEIIDGQHRFEVCKELMLPVRFLILKGYGLNEVQILNTNTKNWDAYDFLNAWCDEGAESYLKMKKFMDDFPEFGISAAQRILTQLSTGRKQGEIDGIKTHDKKDFQSGKFFIPDLEKSYEIANKIQMFKPFFSRYYDATFVSAMLRIFNNPDYNHAEMLTKLKYQPTELIVQNDIQKYRILIEAIYNYRRKEKLNLRF